MKWLSSLVVLIGLTGFFFADDCAAAPVDNLIGPAQLAPARVAPGIHPAIARIIAPGRGSVSYGSGTLVAARNQYGVVITNWHVISECTDQPLVLFPDGFHSPAVIGKVDRDWDLAALVIWKPAAQPVPISAVAPAPGEPLTIAGYGSGTYRAVGGHCTQYVAPGRNFPFEMVELSAMARQGDSGGPILNSRGELAGVLFGAGQGRTSGSYCGRVRWFLSSLTEGAQAPPPQLAGKPPLEQPMLPTRTASNDGRLVDVPSAPARWDSTLPTHATANVTAIAQPKASAPPASVPSPASSSTPPTSALPTNVAQAEPGGAPRYIGWHEIAGNGLIDQAKTILAGFGVLSLLLCFLKVISRE